jgi:hypothetical protein
MGKEKATYTHEIDIDNYRCKIYSFLGVQGRARAASAANSSNICHTRCGHVIRWRNVRICLLFMKCMLISFRSSIRITLENVSRLPIDFLRLIFSDSTITLAQQALAEGTLSVFDTYETEHSLIHKPVFSWDQKDANCIPPGQKLTLTVTCIGKVGW